MKVAEKPSPAMHHSQVALAYDNHTRITTCGKLGVNWGLFDNHNMFIIQASLITIIN
jgi:hypothetical protein